MNDQLDRIIAEGTFGGWGSSRREGRPSNKVRCTDGFTLSVIAGAGTYCSPRPGGWGPDAVPDTYGGPYYEVEVGYPSARPEPWSEWSKWMDGGGDDDPCETVYGYVPVDAVRALVAAHGGVA